MSVMTIPHDIFLQQQMIFGRTHCDFRIGDFIHFINENVYGLLFIIFLIHVFYVWISNFRTREKYQIESVPDRFIAKRCKEDDGENDEHSGRDYIYLVDEKARTYQRLEDTFTRYALGYPRPPRKEGDFFNSPFSKAGYSMRKRIKIRKIILNFDFLKSTDDDKKK